VIEVPSILKSAAEYCGLERVRYQDRKAPTSMDSVVVMYLFGDIRSTVVAASWLVKRYREEVKGSKYFILVSWHGMQDLFPYVDEYWSVGEATTESLYSHADRFENDSPGVPVIVRKLTRFVEDVVGPDELRPYYDNGITQTFWDKFRVVRTFKPGVSSAVVLGQEFSREVNRRPGRKIFLYPSKTVTLFKHGRVRHEKIGKEFWVGFAEYLVAKGHVPVVFRGPLCHDISPDLVERCVYVSSDEVGPILAAMRACDCVVDVFSGVSRLALLARCPFVCCDERGRYMGLKEFEVDDLCGKDIPREYIFSFPTIIGGGERATWKLNVMDTVAAKLDAIFQDSSRDTWPPTSETEEVTPYSNVRRIAPKRMGTRFIRVPRI
jgi:hypothetical protein